MINVTKPFLPSQELYINYLKGIWERQWVTNHGPLVQELEEKLKTYLGVKHLIYVNNGTIALQIALKALGKKGEVITTPFSYVATTNSILWEGCTPVFADIKNTDFNIDPEKIEPLITDDTVAIMATHVYGNPCDVEAIEKTATKHGLKVIYDGAHAFGAEFNGKQVLSFGDIATCSFHATKIFHTIEGGAIITNDDELAKKMILYRQFGHHGDEYFSIGVNGKNSEFHAAMGLCVFNHFDEILNCRKSVIEQYNKLLPNIAKPKILSNASCNYAYYPVVFQSEKQLSLIMETLAKNEIFARRYFYPSLNKLPFIEGNFDCPVSEDISSRVLCLPLYFDLGADDINYICGLINKALNS